MKDTVKLQGISEAKQGTKAIDLKVGDILIWNYGYKSEVVKITISKTGKSLIISEKSFEDGVIRERKTTANRLFVVESKVIKQEEMKAEFKQIKTKITNDIKLDPIEKAIKNRKQTYNSIYSDIGIALEKFPTIELAKYYIKICGTDSALRYYLEEEIIKHEIYKQKAI